MHESKKISDTVHMHHLFIAACAQRQLLATPFNYNISGDRSWELELGFRLMNYYWLNIKLIIVSIYWTLTSFIIMSNIRRLVAIDFLLSCPLGLYCPLLWHPEGIKNNRQPESAEEQGRSFTRDETGRSDTGQQDMAYGHIDELITHHLMHLNAL